MAGKPLTIKNALRLHIGGHFLFTLIVLGVIGLLMGGMMFGDIGIACMVGALAALISGVGFLKVNKAINDLDE